MHYLQLAILNFLAKSGSARFSEFEFLDLTSDHLNFHLKQLVRAELIAKTQVGYELTAKGLEYAGRLNRDTGREIQMPKVSISLGIVREVDGQTEFLLSKRLVDQSRDKIAWHTTKVFMGEKLEEACARCLLDETGLVGKFTYQGVNRVIRKYEDTYEIDVVVLCFKVTELTGELITRTDELENFWISYDEAIKLENTLVGMREDLNSYKENTPIFGEYIN